MKKVLFILFVLLCFIPMSIFADEKVKVYIFESGGCPYCEAEMEYLKSLEGYNKKFEVVSKELYVDHIDWEEGKDYKLGVSVANEFNKAGFKDASYTGTPFVVISDIYAAASYSTSLESIINKAYEEGDRDAVACIEEGKDNCIRLNDTANINNENEKGGIVIAIIGAFALIGMIIYILKNKNKEVVE